jgi:hypothetical protein
VPRRLFCEGLNNIKKSAVSRGENISNKTGQKSCKYGEIIKKPYFFVWGKNPQATPPPHRIENPRNSHVEKAQL